MIIYCGGLKGTETKDSSHLSTVVRPEQIHELSAQPRPLTGVAGIQPLEPVVSRFPLAESLNWQLEPGLEPGALT